MMRALRHTRRSLPAVLLSSLALVTLTSPAPAQDRRPSSKPRIVPGQDPGGIAVALIGTGVAYTLPQIARRLARDGEGDILGIDFEARDNRPLDLDAGGAPASGVRPRGTSAAAVLLGEAPRARLVPVRLFPGEPRSAAVALGFVLRSPARIVVMAEQGERREDWEPFRKAAEAAPGLLLVHAAGDEGRDLDKQPAFPAGFALANALVVAAADAGGRPLATASTGAQSVDIAVPAENIATLAADGASAIGSGSALAAARVGALAARLLAREPKLDAAGLKVRILSLARAVPASAGRTRHGTILRPDTAGD
jgi:hypothetical protein